MQGAALDFGHHTLMDTAARRAIELRGRRVANRHTLARRCLDDGRQTSFPAIDEPNLVTRPARSASRTGLMP